MSGTKKKTSGVQTKLPMSFKQPLDGNSDRAKVITNAIGVFIAPDISQLLRTQGLNAC